MKAVVTVQPNRMELREMPVPEPGRGKCLVRLRYAGICGSDVHIYQGHHPTAISPVVQGHEFVGELCKIGPDTKVGAAIGDRVVVEPLISCGHCEACRVGHWHVCRQLKLLGIHTDGAFAEYVLVDSAKVIRVPDALNDRMAALTEPFAVGFHVCQRAELRNGERALVIGAGPIGLIIAIVAKFSGARVVLCEISDQRIEQAKAMGFEVIDGRKEAMAQVQALTGSEGFEVVFEVSGSGPGLLLATDACRIRGRVVHVGFPSSVPQVNVLRVIFKELTMIGSRVYTFEDFGRTVGMLERIVSGGAFDVEQLVSDTCGLAGVEAGIGKMIGGQCRGKILVDFGGKH